MMMVIMMMFWSDNNMHGVDDNDVDVYCDDGADYDK